MGTDIHMSIISKDGETLYREIFEGRDYEWFDNISGKGYDTCYLSFPVSRGKLHMRKLPDWYVKDKEDEDRYYGFSYLKVEDFIQWTEKEKPWAHAVWGTTHDKWEYDTRGVLPDLERIELTKDDIIEDMHFFEVLDENDSSFWLYNFIMKRRYYLSFQSSPLEIFVGAYIVYYFDC